MTIDEIHKEVSAVKRISRRQVIRYINRCGIAPLGTIRQKPQQFPNDAGLTIKVSLGLAEKPEKIVSLSQLRDVRRRSVTKRNGHANGKGKR